MSLHEEIGEIAEQVAKEMICERFGHQYHTLYEKDHHNNEYRNCVYCDSALYKWQEE